MESLPFSLNGSLKGQTGWQVPEKKQETEAELFSKLGQCVCIQS